MTARRWVWRGLAGAALLAGAAGRVPAQTAPAKPAAAAAAKPAALVNGEAIPAADLDAVVKDVLKSAPPTPVPRSEIEIRQMRQDALEMMIEDTLMHQFLRQYAPKVTAQQVDKELADMEAMLKKNNKSLQELYRDSGKTAAEWRTIVTYRLQWTAYLDAQVNDEVLKKYYAANKDFFDGVRVRASHVALRLEPNAPAADVQAARAKLTALRAQLLENQLDFAAAAKTYSQCTLSAPEGGDVGYVPLKGMVNENFARAAYALQVGQISDVVQTDFGLHLIKVTDRQPGKPADFAKIKDDLRMFYVAEMQQNLMLQMRKSAKIEKNI